MRWAATNTLRYILFFSSRVKRRRSAAPFLDSCIAVPWALDRSLENCCYSGVVTVTRIVINQDIILYSPHTSPAAWRNRDRITPLLPLRIFKLLKSLSCCSLRSLKGENCIVNHLPAGQVGLIIHPQYNINQENVRRS